MNIDQKIAETNAKLKGANNRATIERRGNKLYLRATLPSKPHLESKAPSRQKISLNLKASPAGLQTAVLKAKQLSCQLESGTFFWNEWIEVQDNATKEVSEWLREFEESHWTETEKTGATLGTWRDYQTAFNKLDPGQTLTLDYLISIARTTTPNSRSRQKLCIYLHKLAKFASIEGAEAIQKLSGNYSTKSVQPRLLPKDKLIAECRELIKAEDWQWLYGMLAVYGLRPHEVFRLNCQDFPVVRVLEQSKTGERFIYPLYPEWSEQWNLHRIKLPSFDENNSNAKLGEKISKWFSKNSFGFKAYDLRHSYARRCFEFGLAPDWAAGLMGHSLQVHMNTYRAWIDEAVYRKAYELVINRADRPVPPQI